MTVEHPRPPARLILPPPSPSCVSANPQRQWSISLMKSTQWSSSAGLDVPLEYPSPPMTDSPTSPNRSQFPEERPGVAVSALSAAPPVLSAGLQTSGMASQILPAPVGGPQYGVGSLPPAQPYADYGHGIQPRPRSQSIPGYQAPYLPTAPHHQALGYVGSQPGAVQLISGPLGPVSVGNVPRVGRTSIRRAKAHVARACQNCKKAHLSCDENRPCARCVATRKESTCVDVEHKKRGRPRIQSERTQARPLITPASSFGVQGPPGADLGRGESSLQSQASVLSRRGSVPALTGSNISGAEFGYSHGQRTSSSASYLPPRSDASWRSEPLFAFLNLDLRFLKTSESVRSLLGERQDITNSSLEQFVEYQNHDALSRLQTWLKDERNRIEPMHLPRIISSDQEMDEVQSFNDVDIDRITRNSREHADNYTFRLPGGRSETLHCRIRLARTEVLFFATLTMHSLPHQSAVSSSYGMRRPLEHPATTLARDSTYAPPGPSSPYARSAPGSPFSSLPQHLMTTLPPPMSSIPAAHVSPESRETSGYFPRQLPPTPMHPPPQPHHLPQPSSLSRSRRPEPLGGLLPPLVSSSAPTTPVGAQFNLEQQGPPGSASSSVGGRGVATAPGSVQRRRMSEEPEDEESSRKRRRLNIGEIIEK